MAGSALLLESVMTLLWLNNAAVLALPSSNCWTHSRAHLQPGFSLSFTAVDCSWHRDLDPLYSQLPKRCGKKKTRRRRGPFPRVTAPPPSTSSAAGPSPLPLPTPVGCVG